MTLRTKPDGGFRFISAHELLVVYFAYSVKQIRWYDVRVWFAAHEAAARRCGASNGVLPQYRIEEIAELAGGRNLKQVRGGLRRLEAVGLMHWTESAINFTKSPEDLRVADLSVFRSMLENFGQANRKVPVPRRTIRFIARGARKVLAATMLGHVLRCCYLRGRTYRFEGSCSASWLGRLFGLDERNVKIARQHLVAIGWLKAMSADPWHRQRFGGRWSINPTWEPREERRQSSSAKPIPEPLPLQERSPRIAALDRKRSPLLILKENSFGSKNQKPALAADRPTGVCKREAGCTKPPNLKHVVLEDLRETARTIRLFEDAAEEGLVRRCEADRLKVVAAAERSLRVADRNPCGFFAALVRGRLWHHVNQEEEERARRKLHLHDFGGSTSMAPPLRVDVYSQKQLSMDARVVAAVKRSLTRHRPDIDPFEALHRERPDWTHERWLRAEANLHQMDALR